MARFFVLGPLVWILCLVLCVNADQNNTTRTPTAPTSASAEVTLTTSSNTSANTTEDAGTSVAVPQTNLPTLTTSSNTPADTTEGPSLSHTPTQTSLSPGQATQPDTTSPPVTTIIPLTSTQPSSTLHTSTSIMKTGPTPPRTPTQTSLSTGQAAQPVTTSPPVTTIIPLTSTQPNSTLHTSTSIMGTTKGSCQYSLSESVNKIKAPVVNISGSQDQIYTIRIKDKQNEIHAETIFNRPAFKIQFEWLKPCTVYTVSVDNCTLSGSNTFTSSENGETVPKTVVTSMTDNEVCLKGEFTGIQWDLTECVKITEENSCASTHTVKLDTCTYTMNVHLPPVKPYINFKQAIPSQFEWVKKPAQCNAAALIISCTNNDNRNGIYGLNTSVSLSPYTQYTCTGQYPHEKQPIKSHELSFEIHCDWQKNGLFLHRSSSSFAIFWSSLERDRCSGIEWDSYSASCDSDENSHRRNCTKHSGTSAVCSITGLSPYKTYTCSINGTVNQKHYVIYTGHNTTLSDKPIFKSHIEVHYPSHNSLEIKCENKGPKIVWNGGKGQFRAEITYNGETITANKTKCSFQFPNLYYLTTYKIKITAKNKEGLSDFIITEATTKYNDKAAVGLLIFLIVVISIALLFVPFKMYLLKRKRDMEDEDWTAQDITTSCKYVNVPMYIDRLEKTTDQGGNE